MEKLSEDKQIMAVLEVLGEMKKAKGTILEWNPNASYSEYYTRISLPGGYKFNNSYRYENTEIFKIKSGSIIDEYGEVPLKKVEIEPDVYINVNEITWDGIDSKKASRSIVFSNQGIIHTTKEASKQDMYSYEASYDVLNHNFDISFDDKETHGTFMIRFLDGKLNLTRGNTSYFEDLETGNREIHINNKCFKLEAKYELFKGLTKGLLEVYEMDDESGEILGTYSLQISDEGLSMVYITASEEKDLVYTPYANITKLVETIESSFSATNNDLSEEEKHTIMVFLKSFLYARGKKLSYGNGYRFDGYGFTLDYKSIKDKMIEIIKNIKGEVLLSGLTERIENFLYFLDHPYSMKIRGNSLHLERKKDE